MAVASNGYVPAPAWQPGIELRRHPGLWHHLRHAVDSGATRGAGRGFGAEVSGPGQHQCRPLSDKWLLDYPNMYADLSANSGNDVLSRTPGSSRVSFSKGIKTSSSSAAIAIAWTATASSSLPRTIRGGILPTAWPPALPAFRRREARRGFCSGRRMPACFARSRGTTGASC